MDERPNHARTVEWIVRGCAVVGGRVLVCRNVHAGHAFLPGGHVEFGESVEAALRREMMEEAGVVIALGRCLLLGEASFVQHDRPRHEINIVFHMELDLPTGGGGNPPALVSREAGIAFEWFPVEHLNDPAARFKPEWMIPYIRCWSGEGGSSRTSGPVWVSFMDSGPVK